MKKLPKSKSRKWELLSICAMTFLSPLVIARGAQESSVQNADQLTALSTMPDLTGTRIPSTSPKTLSSYKIVPAKSIGPLNIGADEQKIYGILGLPSQSRIYTRNTREDWWHNETLDSIQIFFENGKVKQISVASPQFEFGSNTSLSTSRYLGIFMRSFPGMNAKSYASGQTRSHQVVVFNAIRKGIAVVVEADEPFSRTAYPDYVVVRAPNEEIQVSGAERKKVKAEGKTVIVEATTLPLVGKSYYRPWTRQQLLSANSVQKHLTQLSKFFNNRWDFGDTAFRDYQSLLKSANAVTKTREWSSIPSKEFRVNAVDAIRIFGGLAYPWKMRRRADSGAFINDIKRDLANGFPVSNDDYRVPRTPQGRNELMLAEAQMLENQTSGMIAECNEILYAESY